MRSDEIRAKLKLALRMIRIVLMGTPTEKCGLLLRLRNVVQSKPTFAILARCIKHRLYYRYGVQISYNALISDGVRLKHPNGIVIGEGVKIGKRVAIFQQVTLGGARMGDSGTDRYPVIGDDSVLFAGAKVLGAVHVGKGCIIGANAVVTQDVPDFHVAVGVPARAHPRRDVSVSEDINVPLRSDLTDAR